jgi:hypothetical protein
VHVCITCVLLKYERSAVVEVALELLAGRARKAELEAELDAYYGTMFKDEREEARAMVAAFNRSQRRRDLDRDK